MDWISQHWASWSMLLPLAIIAGGAVAGLVKWYRQRVVYTILAFVRTGDYPPVTELSVRFEHERGIGVRFQKFFVVANGTHWVEVTPREAGPLWFDRELRCGCARFDVEAHLLASRLRERGLSGQVQLLPVLESTRKRRFHARRVLDFNVDQWVAGPRSLTQAAHAGDTHD